MFRYLRGFHDEEAEGQREEHRAFIPAANEALRGLWEVNGAMLCWMQRRWPQREAPLDMAATLVETQKREALASYQKTKAYQPLTTYGWEAESVVHSEFRDGNVPAGYEQLRVMREALRHLPRGVKTVRLRSDTAGYQQELLKYCAEGKDERFGVIEFAVGVDVTAAFKRAVGRVREREWKPVYRGTGKNRVKTEQEWAEVCFVPNWIARRKKGPAYRFIATRERLREPPLLESLQDSPLDLPLIGSMLSESWMIKRTFAADITNPEIDELYQSGIASGAWGGKLLGAGGGGFMLFLIPPERQAAMLACTGNPPAFPLVLDSTGSQLIYDSGSRWTGPFDYCQTASDTG